MSNELELTPVIEDINGSFQKIMDAYKSPQFNRSLSPDVFDVVAEAIRTAQTALEPIRGSIYKWSSNEVTEARDSSKVAKQVCSIFEQMKQPGRTNCRFLVAEGRPVEALMIDIINGIVNITKTTVDDKRLAADLKKQLHNLSCIPNSLEKSEKHSTTINNHGTGPQITHMSHGDQYMNFGAGQQFNGNCSGPIHFGQMQPSTGKAV